VRLAGLVLGEHRAHRTLPPPARRARRRHAGPRRARRSRRGRRGQQRFLRPAQGRAPHPAAGARRAAAGARCARAAGRQLRLPLRGHLDHGRGPGDGGGRGRPGIHLSRRDSRPPVSGRGSRNRSTAMKRKTRNRSGTTLKAILAMLLLGIGTWAEAVVLDDDRRISVKLDDGTDVVLYGEAGNAREIGWYYLPPRLTVAMSDDGRPEFLFMKFITGTNTDGSGVSGALLHFLVKWGLTAEQEAELRRRIEAEHGGVLKGAAPLCAARGTDPCFSIVSATLQDGQRREQLVSSGAAPLMPGGKAAAAARLDALGAQLLAKTFEPESTITDVTAVFNLAYETQMPAAKGQVVIDWSRIEQDIQRIQAEYSRTVAGREKGTTGCFLFFCTTSESNVYRYSYDEMRNEYHYLMEQRYITFEFE